MPKIVIIGAGSKFGSRISIDILACEALRDSEICLCDIHEGRLEHVRKFVQAAIDHHELPARVVASTDRREVLPDADFVIISVSIGGPAYDGEVYRNECEIPAKYGIVTPVNDTVAPGGIFRGLRTGAVLLEMVKDINELAPKCLILNYTNPMAILTNILCKTAKVQVTGLCHGVQGTSKEIAKALKIPYEELGYECAGINHMAWFTTVTHKKEDMTGRLREYMSSPEGLEKYSVRAELCREFGYFCTESPRHIAEYLPYFKYYEQQLAEWVEFTRGIPEKRRQWYEDMGIKTEQMDSIELIKSHEYAAEIMEAVTTGNPIRFNGNVINRGNITNLPDDACVEVVCLTDREGVHPCTYGDLPEQCAALNRTNINMQNLTVQAVLEKDKEAAYHALLLDPLTMSSLPFREIRKLFEEMWEADRHLLEYWD